MFKELAKTISQIKTENDRGDCYWQIDRAYGDGKIAADEYELLNKLTDMVEVEED